MENIFGSGYIRQEGTDKESSAAAGAKRRSSSTYFTPADPKEPEKEPLLVDTSNLKPENYYLLQSLVRVCNEKLWHYKRFPIVLPEPVALAASRASDSLGKKQAPPLSVDQLFLEPNFNELREVSHDDHSVPKRLTFQQLDSVRASGEFEVDSVRFPGQKHRWLLSQVLIKGKQKTRETMRNDIAKALYFVVDLARECVLGDYFSLFASINGWTRGIMGILDCLVGMPIMRTSRKARQKLTEERANHLVAELICSSNRAKDELIAHLIRLLRQEDWENQRDRLPPIPYHFRTPTNFDIDLRLHGNDLMSSVKPHLLHILSRALDNWFVERKHSVLAELEKEETVAEDIERVAGERMSDEYLERVVDAVLKDSKIQDLGSGVPKLLVQQAKTSCIWHRIQDDHVRTFEAYVEKMSNELDEEHPILYKISGWKSRRMDKIRSEYVAKNIWDTHEKIIEKCRDKGLQQSAYFFERDLNFRQNRESVLAKELSKVKEPCREFEFPTTIWMPRNWKISEKQPDGLYKELVLQIPTVIQEVGESYEFVGRNSQQPTYNVEKTRVVKNSTKYPFWRWTNFFLRTASWMWNCMFMLGVAIPFCSSVSFRALVSPKPYHPKMVLNQKSGCLKRDKSYQVETITSRLAKMWTHIRESRASFESTPDTGLLPKSATRALNRFVNFVIKGFFGTLLIGVGFSTAMITLSTLSICLALTTPIWVVLGSLLLHFLQAVILDIDGPSHLGAILCNVLINVVGCGVLQPVIAAVIAFLVSPAITIVPCSEKISEIILITAVLRRFTRDSWDWVMFNLLIKRRARIPEQENFLARRIAGPGLASEYYYQIQPEQALAALDTKMELDELEAFRTQLSKKISEPVDQYHALIYPLLAPFGVTPSSNIEGPCKLLNKEAAALNEKLNTAVSKRREALTRSRSEMFNQVRLKDSDLKIVLRQGVLMAKDFYGTRVFTRMSNNADRHNFWRSRGLLESDFLGLVSEHLSSFFSQGFLRPLQEADTTFSLKVKHWSLARYVEMANDTKWTEDLDVTQAINVQRPNTSVRHPDMNVDDFNPVCAQGFNDLILPSEVNLHLFDSEHDGGSFGTFCGVLLSKRWTMYGGRRGHHSHLQTLRHPLPVPHPVEIVLVIHNRERLNGGDEETFDFNRRSLRRHMRQITDFPQRTVDFFSDSVVMAPMSNVTTPSESSDSDNVNNIGEEEEDGVSLANEGKEMENNSGEEKGPGGETSMADMV